MAESFQATQLHRLLSAGDRSAWDELYGLAGKRLEALAHRRLRRFPKVQTFEQTSARLKSCPRRSARPSTCTSTRVSARRRRLSSLTSVQCNGAGTLPWDGCARYARETGPPL